MLYLVSSKGQMTLLGAFDYDGPDLSELTVATELVSASEIGGVKPDIMGMLMFYTHILYVSTSK